LDKDKSLLARRPENHLPRKNEKWEKKIKSNKQKRVKKTIKLVCYQQVDT
jgi:hypothetical protein